jgi:hypothetical protein
VLEAGTALKVDRAALAEDCTAIRATLSDRGRRRRARRVRSHLRQCAACRAWDGAQRDRRPRLAALPFGAVSANGSAWAGLSGPLGGGAGAGSAAAGGAAVSAGAAPLCVPVAPGVPAGHSGARPRRGGNSAARWRRSAGSTDT